MVRDYLRERGYEAMRVPLSGASEGFKFDVLAEKDGAKYSFEVKARKEVFGMIYELYYKLRDELNVLRFTSESGKQCVALGMEFDEIKKPNCTFPSPDHYSFHPKALKTFNRILRMQEWLQGADYLVIKGNSRPLLFLRYWG